jgi:hypothetical protein
MACQGRFAQRDLHERRADAALAAVGRDRERPEQQRRPAGPADTSHSRTVPTRRRPLAATNDRPGRRPSRRRSEVLLKRIGP